MRVLVTRPSSQAAPTAQKLAALGHEAIVAPVIEIAPTGAAPPLAPFDLLLATSAQAFAGLTPSEPLLGLPLVCVGQKTARAGRALGFSILCVAADSRALADVLLAEGVTKSALYLAGRERKPHLERRLREKGWGVEIVETYAARPVAAWTAPVVAALERREIDAVLHYSPRSAAIALELMGRQAAHSLVHLCLSEEIASVCGGWAPPDRIVTASHADENSLMSLLRPRAVDQRIEKA